MTVPPKKTYCFLLTFLFYSFISAQSNLSFDLITIEDEISNGYITSIFQDKKGLMWFGTASGLNSYDGYNFKSFNKDHGLSHQTIWALRGDDQKGLWVGTENGLNRFDLTTELFTSYMHDPEDDCSISNNTIESIAKDSSGRIWIGTNNGLNLWNNESQDFTRYFYRASQGEGKIVKSVFCDKESQIWAGAQDTLFRFDDDGSFFPFPIPSTKNTQKDPFYISTIFEDSQNRLWVGTEGKGVFVFEKGSGQFIRNYSHDPKNINSLSHNRITAIIEIKKETYWCATNGGGLNIIEESNNAIKRYHSSAPNVFNVSGILCLYGDKTGNIWIGTNYDGLYIIKKFKKAFSNYTKQNSGLIKSRGVSYAKAPDGKIWFGSNGGGLQFFDPQNETFQNFNHKSDDSNSLITNNVKSVTSDSQGNLWLNLDGGVIARLKVGSKKFEYIKSKEGNCNNRLTANYADKAGNIWITSEKGLCKYNIKNQKFSSYSLSNNTSEVGTTPEIHHVFEDSKGTIWIGTHDGLKMYNQENDRFVSYPSDNPIYKIFESHDGTLWLGTNTGLAKFNLTNKKVEYLAPAKEMPTRVFAIEEHNNQHLWMSGHLGLYRYDPIKNEFIHYNKKDGLINNQFLFGSYKSESNELYFSGISGITRFDPDAITTNTYIPPIIITKFKLNNEDVSVADTNSEALKLNSPLKKAITYTGQIELKHNQNNISFEFSALDFTVPDNNQYKYQLVGYDKKWISTNAERRYANYTNLPPGKYSFRVQGSNNDDKWNEKGASIEIMISYPWWQTWWAILLYVLAIFTFFGLIRKFELRLRNIKIKAKKEEELNHIRTIFYTNITHEFRTPLSIILGTAEQLRKQVSEHGKEGLDRIKQYGNNLLTLINQMLDLSKLESGQLKLNLEHRDVINFLKYILNSFQSLAIEKQIQLQFECDFDEFHMDYDPNRLQHIVSNLISNAIKFTDENGSVILTVKNEVGSGHLGIKDSISSLTITVKDSGRGIQKDKLPYIFDRFYRVDSSITRKGEGTGIGLAIVNELVKLMQGQIQVKSEIGKGSEFIVLLPVFRNEAKKTKSKQQPHYDGSPNIKQKLGTGSIPAIKKIKDRPQVLIVEDNIDLVKYLVEILNPSYNLEIAFDGQEGIDKAIKSIPDVIISDVMMPKKSGFELCSVVKKHELTSHIPIILLTAKVDFDSRLSGFRQGADAYLEKPFQQEELLTRVQALLQQRKRIQDYYLSKFDLNPSPQSDLTSEEWEKLNDPFLEKVDQLILKNLSNAQYSVKQLSKELFVDESNLYRKLKAVIRKTPSQYLRSFRMAEAKKLLVDTDLPISEVSAQCGYENQNYFSRIFKAETDLTPTEYRSQNSK
jgi:signal transduction histidine kinase/ligand-binding sensor domain-containing protein/DNA-binding response OmpR family regulator